MARRAPRRRGLHPRLRSARRGPSATRASTPRSTGAGASGRTSPRRVGGHRPAPRRPQLVAEQGQRGGRHEQPDERDVDEHRGGEPDAGHLDHGIRVGGEAEEDGDHDPARGHDDLARAGRGGRDRRPVVGVPVPLLADPREQEHVVVRREPEQDREHEQRHVGHDGLLLDAEQARSRRGLERERDDAVRGGDRGEVEGRGEERDPPGAERHEQEQQRQADDRAGEQRDAGGDLLRLVAEARRPAADVRRRARAAEGGGDGARRAAGRRAHGSLVLRAACAGSTVITAVSPAGLSTGRATSATSRSARRRLTRRASGRSVSPFGSETATTSGPLTPGPKPSASRSYAWRCVASGVEVAVVGLAELQPGSRGGERHAGGAGRREREPRPARRPRARAVRRRRPASPSGLAVEGRLALAARQQPPPGAPEAGGQQDDADDGARQHDEPGGDARAAHERDAGDQQPGDRDEHDARGGQRRVAGARVGPPRGLHRVPPGP